MFDFVWIDGSFANAIKNKYEYGRFGIDNC